MAKILLAKSDCAVRRHLMGSLRGAGHAVTVSDRGDVAYDMMRAEPFDIVLCDVAAAGMDGLALASVAADLDEDLRFMLIVGFSAMPVVVRGADEGGAAPRPVHLRALPEHLKESLAA